MKQTKFKSADAENLIDIYDFSLFPLYGIVNGMCACGNPNCTSPGKHPLTQNGFHSSTKDIEKLKKLFPNDCCNVGIATGEPSGVFVVDIDDDIGRKEIEKVCKLPVTLMATTGRGTHYFYKWPGEPVISKNGFLPKVDIKGDGGYVVGAGSLHQTGTQYQFINPLEEIADAPEALLNLVIKSRIQKERQKPQVVVSNSLFSRGGEKKTPEEVADMLSYLDADMDYDDWVHVGMALHAEGYDVDLWENWSAKSKEKHQEGLCYEKWDSFNGSGGISFGTLVKMARDNGWDARPQIKSVEKIQETVQVAKETKRRSKYTITTGDNIEFDPNTADFVQGLLTEGAMSLVYGESNCGKTFFMSDLAFHIAEGNNWNERRVEQGGVLYVCLEGKRGLSGRVKAYKDEKGVELKNFATITEHVDFMATGDENDVEELILAVEDFKEQTGVPVKLIVIDTLARAMAGGDENSGSDMSVLVRNGDLIRNYVNAHICFVHHSGKDRALGARGHSSLRAAVDTEIEIHRPEGANYSTVTVSKQRDMDMGEPWHFSLKPVVIGKNGFFEDVTSCIVEPYDGSTEAQTKGKKPSHSEEFVLKAIKWAIEEKGRLIRPYKDGEMVTAITYDDLAYQLEEMGDKSMFNKDGEPIVKSATASARKNLKGKGHINFNGRDIWLV